MILDFKETTTCFWMSLDRCVSCMAAWRTAFTLCVGHLALGCHFHVHFFFCDIFGVEMWDRVRNVGSQLWTTLHTVFGSCFRNKWACSLAVGLFSHCRIHFVDPRYVMLLASGRNMCRPAPQFAEKRKKRVCLRDGGGPYSGVKHHEAFGSIRWGNKKNRKSMNEKCKICPSYAVWRLGIVVCGNCVWSSWRDFDSLRSPVALQWKYSVYLTGWVKFHIAASSILLFLALFYKYLKRFGSISWTESLCKSRNAKAISLWHDKGPSCRYWSKCLLIPFCFHCYVCSKSLALGAVVHAASLSRDLFHGNVPRAKTSEWSCKRLTLNSRLSKLFKLMLGAQLYYSTHVVLKFWLSSNIKDIKDQDHDPSHHLSWFHLLWLFRTFT